RNQNHLFLSSAAEPGVSTLWVSSAHWRQRALGTRYLASESAPKYRSAKFQGSSSVNSRYPIVAPRAWRSVLNHFLNDKNSVKNGFRGWRAARYININRNNLIYALKHVIR